MTENRSFLYNTNELNLHSKQVLYTVCFVILCFIDQIKNSATLIPQEGFVNLTGLCIAAIILSHFKAKDFFSLPYLIWVIYFFCGVFLNRKAGLEECDNAWQWYTAAANVGIFGLIAIRLILGMITKKEKPQLNLFFFPLWCIIMIGMMLSRHDAVWPLWFFVMFGCFYLTNFTKEEWEAILKGLMNGIIIGFFLLQGFACMFRAFELIPRYIGIQINGNMYALICLLAAVALLTKLCCIHSENGSLFSKIFICILFGIVTSFLLLTICRTAILALIPCIFFFILHCSLTEKHFRITKSLFRGCALLMSILFAFAPVYYSARWIQPEFIYSLIIADDAHKNLKIRNDTETEKRIYIEFNRFFVASFGRFDELKNAYDKESDDGMIELFNKINRSFFPMCRVSAAPWDIMITKSEVFNFDGSGTSKDDPLLNEHPTDSIQMRRAIYQYYISCINNFGHPSSNSNVWISKIYSAPHAHNLFLQFLFDFGFYIGCLFIILFFLSLIFIIIKYLFIAPKTWSTLESIIFLIAFLIFGLFEIDWRIGHMAFTLYFLLLYNAMNTKILKPRTGLLYKRIYS